RGRLFRRRVQEERRQARRRWWWWCDSFSAARPLGVDSGRSSSQEGYDGRQERRPGGRHRYRRGRRHRKPKPKLLLPRPRSRPDQRRGGRRDDGGARERHGTEEVFGVGEGRAACRAILGAGSYRRAGGPVAAPVNACAHARAGDGRDADARRAGGSWCSRDTCEGAPSDPLEGNERRELVGRAVRNVERSRSRCCCRGRLRQQRRRLRRQRCRSWRIRRKRCRCQQQQRARGG
ncbi:unnamed protein product, partial [Ectocarpus fasciculatus]